MAMGEPYNASDEPRNPAVLVRVEAAGAEPEEGWLFLPLMPGQPRRAADYGDYRISPVDFEPAFNTVLEFKTHPVLWPVWLGCGVMMAGVVLCFYCNHERVWALVEPREGGGCRLWLAGDAFKWRERFRERFDAVVRRLEQGESV
jgi:cytochrome c biogenesis protein